ncbi:hypothetical protein B0H66DRAFT_600847 [Apodospora peruviana]|uniref:Uncharacterized protein n=1 Tax=Apodospora peruviana TaxID=516989 RepID=A0AAE0IKD6_9PEZI|nr:hypothetical protein B0H66DRAFT_600847 [Apodospora peruviana]
MWHSVWAWFLLLLLSSTNTLVEARTQSHHAALHRHPKDIFQHGPHQLASRQTDEESSTTNCNFLCDIETCGASCLLGAAKRDENGLPAVGGYSRLPAYYADSNSSSISSRSLLGKRAFDLPRGRMTADRADKYVMGNVLQSDIDPQFPDQPLGFFDGDMKTVSQAETFGNDAFAFGTQGLHGCTMMTIVSNRAVYMAHYWESYTTNDNDVITGNDLRLWEERVLDSIRGATVTNPYNPPEERFAYKAPFGRGVDWTLFNQPGDNTAVYFMTPLATGVTNEKSDKIKYPQKIALIEALVKSNVPGAKVNIIPYNRLRYSVRGGTAPTGPDAHLVDKSSRGMCLFQ